MATELVRAGQADVESVRERVPPPFADTKKPTMPVQARSAAELRGNQMGATLHGRTRAETRQRSKEPALTSRPKRRRRNASDHGQHDSGRQPRGQMAHCAWGAVTRKRG